MNIVVPIKVVPDLVEELAIDDSGAALDTDWLRLMLSEFDDHAIEQAILLKERDGGQVTVVAADAEGVDDVLYAAAAKGADRLIKLTGDFEEAINNHALARVFAAVVKELQPDLVLTGVQSYADMDGSVGPLMAEYLGMPYVGYVAGVAVSADKATARKEYPGGLVAEMEVTLPAVLGIQASEDPPRYVAFSKIRQAMKTAMIDEHSMAELDLGGALTVGRMFQPELGEGAEMLGEDADEVATRIVEILKDLDVL